MLLLSQKSTNWFKTAAEWKKRLLLSVSLFAFGVLYLKVLSPTLGIHIPCVFHEVTDLYCPGCGITRTCLALLRGDFAQAFRYNPLVFILAPIYLSWYIANKTRLKKASSVIMMTMIMLTLLFFALRNIPMFDYLAPTIIK